MRTIALVRARCQRAMDRRLLFPKRINDHERRRSLAPLLLLLCAGLPESSDARVAAVEGAHLLRNPRGDVSFLVPRDQELTLGQLDAPTVKSAKAWLAQAEERYGLSGRSDRTRALTVELELDRVVPAGALEIVRFRQKYRGVPIAGAGATVSITRTRSGSVVSFSGPIVDSSADLVAWEAGTEPRLDALDEEDRPRATLFASVERGIYTYRVESEPEGLDDPEERILDAATGEEIMRRSLGAKDAFTHVPIVSLLAHTQVNDPATAAVSGLGGLPGSTYGVPNPMIQLMRMGSERMVIYDAQLHNEDPPLVRTTLRFLPNSFILYGIFNAASGFAFNTQDAFARASRALTFFDPVQSSFGWITRRARRSASLTPPPLTVIANADSSPEAGEPNPCSSNLGATALASFNGWGGSLEHPYATNAYSQARISLCSTNAGVVLHELGHYIDDHNTYNVLGTGVNSGTCHTDTTDEAHSLRETVADMFAIYFARKLYPSLPYTQSTAMPPCTFEAMGRGLGQMHHNSCITSAAEIGWFDDDRPGNSNVSACTPTQGYRMTSINQATWAFMRNQLCSRTAPYNCASAGASANADRFARAMIYALQVSNQQSYDSFFENMSTYLWAIYGNAERNAFRAVFSNYGIIDPSRGASPPEGQDSH